MKSGNSAAKQILRPLDLLVFILLLLASASKAQQAFRKADIDSIYLRAPSFSEIATRRVASALPKREAQVIIRSPKPLRRFGAACGDTSLRTRYLEDSSQINAYAITQTRDGNLLVPGWRASSFPPYRQIGYLMKCRPNGDTLWVRNIAGTQTNAFYYTDAYELFDGSILLTGQVDVPVPVNSRSDLVLTKLSATGDFIWQKTFASRVTYYTGNNPRIDIYDLQSTADGSIFLCGGIIDYGFSRFGFAARLAADGTPVWSNALANSGFIEFVGFNLVGGELHAYGSTIENTIILSRFDAATGDTLATKAWMVPLGPNAIWNGFRPFEVTHLANGNTALSGRCITDVYSPDPNAVGHVAVMELSPSFKVVDAFRVVNKRQPSTYDNTRIKVYKDGSAAFCGVYGGPALHIGKIVNGRVIQEREIRYSPSSSYGWNTNFVSMPDGGDCLAANIGEDYLKTGIELFRLHDADTLGDCLGSAIEKSVIVLQAYIPTVFPMESFATKVLKEVTIHEDYLPYPDGCTIQRLCGQVSACDSLKLSGSAKAICLPGAFTVTVHKNPSCNSPVEWVYDTSSVNHPVYLSDTTVQFSFKRGFQGYIKGRIAACTVLEDSAYVTVSDMRPAVNLGPDKTLCPGNTIVVNAESGYASYTWQDGSTDSSFTVRTPGTYSVRATDACGNVFRDSITITAAPPISFDAGPDRTKCNDDTLHLSAPDGFLNYIWSNNQNGSLLPSQNIVVGPLVGTAFYIKAEKTPGCFAYDTVRVTVNLSPPIDLGANGSFCKGDSLLLNAGSGFQSYVWSTGAASSTVTVKDKGSYWVVGTTSKGCKSSDTVQVLAVYPLPVVQLEKVEGLCDGEARTLDAGSFATYRWQDGSTAETFTATGIGTYFVDVTDTHGCKGSDTTVITKLYPLPLYILPADTAICSYGKLELRALSTFKSYSWNTGSGTPSITIDKPGLYWLQVEDNHNCKGSDSIQVALKECMQGLYVPTAFSPNGDGKNDEFRPLLFGNVKQYNFTVYNRWGQAVFKSSERGKGWNGKVGGTPQESSVFVWTCTYQLEGGELKREKGTVTIIR